MPETAEDKKQAEDQKAADDAAAATKTADEAAAAVAAGQAATGGEKPLRYDAWFEALDETAKGLITEHTTGLKSALDAERGTRKDLEGKLRDAASKLEEGSEARKVLEEQAATVAADGERADFHETAHAEGVTNLRLAWLAVQADDSLLDRRGNVDFAKLKEDMPELFAGAPKPAPGNAGAGAASQQKGTGGMNEFIRTAAGRSSR